MEFVSGGGLKLNEEPDRQQPGGESRMKKFEQKMTPFRNAAPFVNMPITLLACTLVGWGIGSLIEKRWNTGGVFVMIFTMLGVAAGFKELFVILKKAQNKGKNSDDDSSKD